MYHFKRILVDFGLSVILYLIYFLSLQTEQKNYFVFFCRQPYVICGLGAITTRTFFMVSFQMGYKKTKRRHDKQHSHRRGARRNSYFSLHKIMVKTKKALNTIYSSGFSFRKILALMPRKGYLSNRSSNYCHPC